MRQSQTLTSGNTPDVPLLPFSHPEVAQTALPLGGIGAGCICLNGYGGLQDFSIRNRPSMTALPDGNDFRDAAFALLHVAGTRPVTRLLEGPLPTAKIYDQGLQAQGHRKGGHEGLPRFRRSRFRSGYPFGHVALSDPAVPLEVGITGWSPFIPLDDVASGLPCAILEYTFTNIARRAVEFDFSYHASNFAFGTYPTRGEDRSEVLRGKGVCFRNTLPAGAEAFGSASISLVKQPRPKIKAAWLRGGWFDGISALWHEIESGRFTADDGKAGAGGTGRLGGSVSVRHRLAPGVAVTIPVVLTWYFPNSRQTYGAAPTAASCAEGESCCAGDDDGPLWRPFYAARWRDAADVAGHVHREFDTLRARTVAFQRALFSSDLPKEVLDAVSANLAILKSPTILRLENGSVWGWEGCFTDVGCCNGSCTHVWNYAQAMPHLFPALERTLREQELERSMDERGHVSFRSALPEGPAPHDFHAAADGQLGGIMKLHRDWQIGGDTAWLTRLYPAARSSLEYCINAWDPEREGVLSEPHHNTYDIEFWGPDGMCGSVYIGALCAMSEMAHALGHAEDADAYRLLAESGARLLETQLFNGDYFEQKVRWRGLRDTSFLRLVSGQDAGKESPAMLGLLKKEGPKYQYGSGCLSDGIIGEWMARIYGIRTPLDRAKVRRNLRAIHRYNFRSSLREHANCQRPGYALGDDAGLLLCSWPRGGKPTLPFVYSDEVWTGIEYQVASHLIAEDYTQEGLEIVRATRRRYDGRTRNPWNEYECGSYYARAMASYALLSAWSGFRYSAVEQTLWLAPASARRPFQIFFSASTGFGTIRLDARRLTVSILEGHLTLRQVILGSGRKAAEFACDLSANPRSPVHIDLSTHPGKRLRSIRRVQASL